MFQTKKLQTSELKKQAVALNLDTARFDQCLESGEQGASVKKDSQEAQRLGLQGTPSFFINGHFMSGSIGFQKLRDTVMQELTTANNKKQSAALVPSTNEVKKVKVRNPSPEKQGPAKSRWAFYYLIMGLLFNSCWDWPAKLRPMVAQS